MAVLQALIQHDVEIIKAHEPKPGKDYHDAFIGEVEVFDERVAYEFDEGGTYPVEIKPGGTPIITKYFSIIELRVRSIE